MSIGLLFVLACVIILVLVVFMFLILKNTVNKINKQTKMYFVDKLQEYDYLIDEKEKKLDQINEEIKEKELDNNLIATENKNDNYEFDYNIINLLNETKYQDKNIFEISKKIESKFNIDYVKIINKFIENNIDDSDYVFCINLRKKFDSETIYSLKILESDMMEGKLKEILEQKELKIYYIYRSITDRVSLEGFIDYLNELVDLNNPYILIYVGNKNENYDNLSKYIVTKYDAGIYKGIKIVYKNKVYDYSLSERNV